ncbi:MAG TPA: hypothetical protein VHR97_01155 [Candidatus Baltobacteraceae bacterium]|jgi:hypothetical protein|nr:hypothetical protein [Candidatus Baltobacteraceae bacterium]
MNSSAHIAATTLAVALLGAAAATPSPVLPRSAILELTTVQKYFPQVTREQYSGMNKTAAANPVATRSVIFASGDGSKKVTLTVDRYASGGDALSAFHQAVAKSKIPGFVPISIPVIGQSSFAGRVTRGNETHVGIGSVDGNLVVGATLAGYSATDANVQHLISLAHLEDAQAKR